MYLYSLCQAFVVKFFLGFFCFALAHTIHLMVIILLTEYLFRSIRCEWSVKIKCDWLCKRGLIANPISTYLVIRTLPCEFGTTLKLGLNIALLIVWCHIKGDSINNFLKLICKS